MSESRVDAVRAAEPSAALELARRRPEFRVLRTITTRWMDNDHYGHVNNVVYYSYFDTAVNGYLIEASGCDIRELPQIGIVAETSCRFLRELSFPDVVHAGLALEKLGNSSVVYRIGLFRNDDVEPAALGRFVHVYVDRETRRPVPVPGEVRRAVERLSPVAGG
jgi:acyl-CoA thioester hydrolase